ncbi:hypothetical protein Q9966_016249 [Columba livia]|nr:hypothetical protein Q9966_016249 [Columba livia]
MERGKMAELESLETAAEHERILREIESTDTACIGPTLSLPFHGINRRFLYELGDMSGCGEDNQSWCPVVGTLGGHGAHDVVITACQTDVFGGQSWCGSWDVRSVYDGEEHGRFMEKLEARIRNHDREIEKMCNFHYQGFVDSITELLKVRGEAQKLKVRENPSRYGSGLPDLGQAYVEELFSCCDVKELKPNCNGFGAGHDKLNSTRFVSYRYHSYKTAFKMGTRNQVTDTNRKLQNEGKELIIAMEELKQCRLQQRNISATVDKLTLCLPVLEMYSKLREQMKSKRLLMKVYADIIFMKAHENYALSTKFHSMNIIIQNLISPERIRWTRMEAKHLSNVAQDGEVGDCELLHYPALKTLEHLEHTYLPQVSHYRFCKIMVDNIPKLREEIKEVSMSDLKDFLESIRKHSDKIGETAMKQLLGLEMAAATIPCDCEEAVEHPATCCNILGFAKEWWPMGNEEFVFRKGQEKTVEKRPEQKKPRQSKVK